MSILTRIGFALVKRAIRRDPELAWSWHSNLAMASYDAMPTELSHRLSRHRIANEGAAAFMVRCFGVDTFEHPHFREFENHWKAAAE